MILMSYVWISGTKVQCTSIHYIQKDDPGSNIELSKKNIARTNVQSPQWGILASRKHNLGIINSDLNQIILIFFSVEEPKQSRHLYSLAKGHDEEYMKKFSTYPKDNGNEGLASVVKRQEN